MPQFVILGSGKVPRLLAEHSDSKPLAIVVAESASTALDRYRRIRQSNETESTHVIPISSWGHTGIYIEPEGENEPICPICIEEDGGYTGEEEKLSKENQGPCWRCLYLLRESGIEYID